MGERRVGSCGCGHDWALHDAWGCAAYLGAFEETRGEQRYCGCRMTNAEVPPAAPEEPLAEQLAG